MNHKSLRKRDERLYNIYLLGFNDCFDNNDNSIKYKKLDLEAYKQGWSDSIVGDDVRSVDYRSIEDTIKLIQKNFLNKVAEELKGKKLFPKLNKQAKDFLNKINNGDKK